MIDSNSSVGRSTRFRKGQSGNPGGRPKSRVISEALRAQLSELVPGDPQGRTFAEAIAGNLIDIACTAQGSEAVHAANQIADRIEGKVKQQLEVDFNAELRSKSDEELLFHIDNHRWPTAEELALLQQPVGPKQQM